jgi:hypothetical protein
MEASESPAVVNEQAKLSGTEEQFAGAKRKDCGYVTGRSKPGTELTQVGAVIEQDAFAMGGENQLRMADAAQNPGSHADDGSGWKIQACVP